MNVSCGSGVEKLMSYYQARRLLASCLLLPVAAGILYAQDINVIYPFLAWFFFCQTSMGAMGDLVIYSANASLKEKASRWRSILWENARHMLVGYACAIAVLFLLYLIHGREIVLPTPHVQNNAEDLSETARHQNVALFAIFWTAAFIPFMRDALVNKHNRKRLWWILAFMVHAFLHRLNIVFLLLPHILAIPLYLLGLASRHPEYRNKLILHASDACFCASSLLFLFFLALPMLQILLSAELPAWAFDPLRLAAFASAFGLCSFMLHEKIRLGLFIADSKTINQQKLSWSTKNRVARALNPMDRKKSSWQFMQFIIWLGGRYWLVALASVLLGLTISLF